jgi:hypothetical protein
MVPLIFRGLRFDKNDAPQSTHFDKIDVIGPSQPSHTQQSMPRRRGTLPETLDYRHEPFQSAQ